MIVPRFDYFALHYLNFWLTHDRVFCDALNGGNEKEKLNGLASAAAFYRIARNLPKKYEERKGYKRFKPVLEIIDSQDSKGFIDTELVPAVLKIRDQISDQYGGRNALSLTTKFLWLKIKTPVIIYDRRARKAMNTKSGDLHEFYTQWKEGFHSHLEEIESACRSLKKVKDYYVNPVIATEDYVDSLVSQRWFKERVFDVYLWHLGG